MRGKLVAKKSLGIAEGSSPKMDYSLVDQRNWNSFCDFVSRNMRGRRVEIETESLDCRDRIDRPTVRMQGLSYNEAKDQIEIRLENDDNHVIAEPRYIVMGEQPISIGSISILDSTNHLQIIVFKNSLLLSSPTLTTTRRDEHAALTP